MGGYKSGSDAVASRVVAKWLVVVVTAWKAVVVVVGVVAIAAKLVRPRIQVASALIDNWIAFNRHKSALLTSTWGRQNSGNVSKYHNGLSGCLRDF